MFFKSQLVGHLGQDATTRNHNGNTCISFSIAHTIAYKDQAGNRQERTTWVDCAYWRNNLENFIPFLKKGQLVLVEGEVSARAYTAKDGTVKAALDLRVSDCKLLGKAPQKEAQSAAAPMPAPAAAYPNHNAAPVPNYPPGGQPTGTYSPEPGMPF